METLLVRRQEDSGHKQLDDGVISFRANSYVRHMEALGIPREKYNDVYELATQIYNEQPSGTGPFGVDFMIKAAKRLTEKTKTYRVFQKPERLAMVSCTSCQGSKLAYKKLNGKIIGVERDAKGKFMKCPDCNDSQHN